MNHLYLLVILPALLGWYAQSRVRRVYDEHGKQSSSHGSTGLDVARRLLAHHELNDVTVERAEGHFADHYDPQTRTLRLSDAVARGSSVTAMGIVAHEVGHAVQDAEGYRFMRVHTTAANRLSAVAKWSSFIFLGGMVFGNPLLMALGGALLAAMVVFSMITLPVERNASDRALKMLKQTGLASVAERQGVNKLLRSAALTYVGALAHRLGSFLMFVVVIGVMRGMGQA